jgi:hypothetical protein
MISSKKTIILSVLFSFLSTSFLLSQNPPAAPIEWKKVPMEDLLMTSYEPDPGASALILCDYGFTSFNDDLHLIFDRHLRIKIFNENGYKLTTHSIGIYDNLEYIDDIRGITYNINENGKILTTNLDDDDIIKEKLTGDFITHKFTMPGLKPGCIVDIKYRIVTDHIAWVRDWTFQHSEPVRWSEYRVMSLRSIAYSAITRGFEQFNAVETYETSKVVSGRARSFSGESIAKCNLFRWVVKNAPAIREEPYMTCPEDYMNKVDIQLSGYAIPGFGVETVHRNWEDFVKNEYEGWYKKRISSSGKIKDLASRITGGLSDPEKKLKAIYNWVTQSIVWSGKNSRFPSKKMEEVIELKSGNSADINILLISLLQSAGLSCDPLVLSTRSNGKIQDLYPIAHQFNYILVKATVDSKNYFLDATDPLRPYDLLPEKVLYTKALAIKEGKPEWHGITCDKKNLTHNIAWLNFDEEGKISGYFENSYGEYTSLHLRKNISGKSDKNFASEHFEAETYGFEIDSVVLDKDSIHLPFKIRTYFSSDNYAQITGDMTYFNPNLVFRIKDNPFKTAARKFPVNYPYVFGTTTIINIQIPEGYVVKEGIKNKNIFSGASNINYSRKTMLEGKNLQIICKLDVKELEIKPAQYERLREFYSQVIAAQSEQIVLAKEAVK